MLAVASCQPPRDPVVFFPIGTLVDQQVLALTDRGAGLTKQAVLGSETEAKDYIPADTSAWRKELDIFAELETINRPANRNSYVITDGLRDTNSNLLIREFTDTTGLPVRYLRVYYHETADRPRIIEALYETDHALYATSRKLNMEFRRIGGKLMLTTYSVRGWQKMMLGDTVEYSISGKIQFK